MASSTCAIILSFWDDCIWEIAFVKYGGQNGQERLNHWRCASIYALSTMFSSHGVALGELGAMMGRARADEAQLLGGANLMGRECQTTVYRYENGVSIVMLPIHPGLSPKPLSDYTPDTGSTLALSLPSMSSAPFRQRLLHRRLRSLTRATERDVITTKFASMRDWIGWHGDLRSSVGEVNRAGWLGEISVPVVGRRRGSLRRVFQLGQIGS
jgi:hypothetical protein